MEIILGHSRDRQLKSEQNAFIIYEMLTDNLANWLEWMRAELRLEQFKSLMIERTKTADKPPDLISNYESHTDVHSHRDRPLLRAEELWLR